MYFLKTISKAMTGIAVLAALLVTATAHAGTVVQTFNYGPQLTNWDSTASFNYFDTTLGTLTSVQWDVAGTTDIGYSVDNDNLNNATFTPGGNATVEVSSIPGVTGGVIQVFPVASTSFTLAGDDGDGPVENYTGPDSKVATISDTKSTSVSALPVSLYNGPGTFDVNVAATGVAGVFGPGNFQSKFQQDASVKLKLTYNYAPAIPEPGTLALLAPAVLGLVAIGRRRKN